MRHLPHTVLAICLLSAFASASASEHEATVELDVTGFTIEGDSPLTDAETQAVLAPYLGRHTGVARLREAAARLEQVIHEAGHPFYRVTLPPQTIEDGLLRVRILAVQLAAVEVTGNKYFSSGNVRRSVPSLEEGRVPDTKVLARQLIVANEHPSKQVTVRFKQSETPASVDAELAVQDRRPWQIFAVLNNIGTEETGDYRISAGFQHANLFDRDHAITLSYTTSPDHTSEVQQFGASYAVPLYPFSGTLSLYYSRSDVDSGTIQEVFDVSGAGRFAGATYTQTLASLQNYRHKLALSVEDKQFDNDIDFQGLQLGTDVRSRPLTLTYSGNLRRERSNLGFELGYLRNLPGGSDNDDATYALVRAGAERSWQAIRYSASAAFTLGSDWLLSAMLEGQHAGEPLISGEQFGIGGAGSIRGFEERAVTGDRGQRLSLEVWTPPLGYDVRLLGFVDLGHAAIKSPAAGQIKSETLISTGLGLRWRWKDRLSLSLDYGHELNDAEDPDAGGVKTHFSLFCRF